MFQGIHDRGGANPSNVRLDVLNLNYDHCDSIINKYFLHNVVIIKNRNELSKKDMEKESSTNLKNFMAEI